MTPTRARNIIDIMGWSQKELADLLGMGEGFFRGQLRGARPFREDVAAWLTEMEPHVLAIGEALKRLPLRPPAQRD